MGLTFIEGEVSGPSGKHKRLQFLVDSGATYTLLPKDVWNYLELKPKREVTFTLADGTQIKRQVSECYIVLEKAESHTPVILGEEGDDALIGTVTLENLGLVLDPFKRELHAMQMRLS